MAIFTSECCMTISTQYAQDATIMAPKFTPKLNPQVQVLLNLYIHVTDIWWLTNCRDFWWCKTILPAQCVWALEEGKTKFRFLRSKLSRDFSLFACLMNTLITKRFAKGARNFLQLCSARRDINKNMQIVIPNESLRKTSTLFKRPFRL